MVRTAIESRCKTIAPTSATAFSVAGYGKVTILVNVTTANGGISAMASGTSSAQSNTVKVLKNDGVTETATVTSASTGAIDPVSYIGSDDYLKITYANASVLVLLSEPVLSN